MESNGVEDNGVEVNDVEGNVVERSAGEGVEVRLLTLAERVAIVSNAETMLLMVLGASREGSSTIMHTKELLDER
jgi:hypothetical protein